MSSSFTDWLWIIPAVTGVAFAIIGWLWIVDMVFEDKQDFGFWCFFWPGIFPYVGKTWPRCRVPMNLLGFGLAFGVGSTVLFMIQHSN